MNHLLNIPETPLSKEDYKLWITDIEGQLNKQDESVDRHSCIAQGYKLEEAMTPGIYIRELTMPANALIVSRVHLQEHPFVILKGKVTVYDGDEVITIEAPYKGITKKGTKRILHTLEETTWVTFHPVDDGVTIEDCDNEGVITCASLDDYERLEGLAE